MANDLIPGSKAGREMLGSRLGFLLLSAGCAIGLGNVWRFPFITGAYGGAIFVLVYLVFLFAILPIMIMEFAVGRASRLNMGLALEKLEPHGTRWDSLGWVALAGSYLLMMFYTTVTGWMLIYCWYMGFGSLEGLNPAGVGNFFNQTLADPMVQIIGMTITVAIGFAVCAMGVRRGVERIVKFMMMGLLLLLVALVARSLMLPNAGSGASFYLMPDWKKFSDFGFLNVCNAAMNQAFFTLSVGIGAMCIFGSYQPKERSLTGEAVWIAKVLDLFEEQNILANVNETGAYLYEKLDALTAKYDQIRAHRGIGLMQGLECDMPVNDIIHKAIEKGLLLINAGTNIIRFIPPLIVSKADVDKMIEIVDACFAEQKRIG